MEVGNNIEGGGGGPLALPPSLPPHPDSIHIAPPVETFPKINVLIGGRGKCNRSGVPGEQKKDSLWAEEGHQGMVTKDK